MRKRVITSVALLLGMVSPAMAEPPSEQEILRAMRPRLASIRACYEVLLRRGSDEAGKLVLQLDVSDDGRVTRADVATETLHDAKFLTCVRQRALSWRLSQGGVQLSYAVVFQPGQ